jgi:WD40 repeat protein
LFFNENYNSLLELENGDLAIGSENGIIRTLNMKTGQKIKTIGCQWSGVSMIDTQMGSIEHLVLMNDGQIAAVQGRIISIVELNKSCVVKSFIEFDSRIRSFVILSNNNLACLTDNFIVHILNVHNENESPQAFQLDDRPTCLLALPNERLVIGDKRGRIQILNAQTGERVQQFDARHDDSCILCLILLNETKIASGSRDAIKVWDLSSGQVLCYFSAINGNMLYNCTLFKNGILAIKNDDDVFFWNWENVDYIDRHVKLTGSRKHHSYKAIKIVDLSSGQVLRTFNAIDCCTHFDLFKNGILAIESFEEFIFWNWENGNA